MSLLLLVDTSVTGKSEFCKQREVLRHVQEARQHEIFSNLAGITVAAAACVPPCQKDTCQPDRKELSGMRMEMRLGSGSGICGFANSHYPFVMYRFHTYLS